MCGECVCNIMDGPMFGVDNPLITGDACECSNFECEQDSDGVVCSGRGTCICSDSVYRCDCDTSDITKEQHTGGACQCSTDHCIDPTMECVVGVATAVHVIQIRKHVHVMKRFKGAIVRHQFTPRDTVVYSTTNVYTV